MKSRRQFIQATGLFLGGVLFNNRGITNDIKHNDKEEWFMPEESEPHQRTWMAFIASYDVWAERQVPAVQRNLAAIAKTIAKYEPVSILVRKRDYKTAVKLLNGLDTHNYPITLVTTRLNDLWIRDTGPTFVINEQGDKAAIDFNFNGWGEKQEFTYDAEVASLIAEKANVETISSSLTLEGGCFEVDGEGTAIMSESCILNNNRNPNKSKKAVESELKELLGLDKIIWLKGIKGKDITDGHTDFYARFASPGVVVVSRDTDRSSYDYKITRENIQLLQSATDANNRKLKLIILDTPWKVNSRFGIKDFAAGYVGYYVCNGAVIMQKFGDKKADSKAKAQLAKAFPNHTIEQISLDGIASGGGSIHCATQQEPRVNT